MGGKCQGASLAKESSAALLFVAHVIWIVDFLGNGEQRGTERDLDQATLMNLAPSLASSPRMPAALKHALI